jgi:hypothetical protein
MGMNDFGFFTGTWDVTNRRRVDFLDSGSEWEEFPAISQASVHFDGGAHFDEITFPTKGYAGLTLRLYDQDTGQWSLYWVSKRNPVMLPPVTGQFKDGIGDFLGQDDYNDVPVLVRYRWSGITESAARWAQAFSVDGGQSWLDNWYMDMTRRH